MVADILMIIAQIFVVWGAIEIYNKKYKRGISIVGLTILGYTILRLLVKILIG